MQTLPDCLYMEARHLEILNSILSQYLPDAEVWAYGSRVTGKAHDTSDLDLVVRNSTSLAREVESLAMVKEALQDSNLPIRVDLIDWALIPQNFRDEISRHYCVIQPGTH